MKKRVLYAAMAGLLFLVFSCRNEEEGKPKIESLKFEVENKTSVEGDTVKLSVIALPVEAKAYDRIVYWASDNSLLEIMPNSDNEGVIFRSLKAGTGVIKASVNGISVFCEVKIIGAGGNLIPYITLSDYVIEGEEGESRKLIGSLVGGLPQDESGWIWTVSGQSGVAAELQSNGGTALLNMPSIGTSIVTASHQKARFGASALVFVTGKGDAPVYISTNSNALNLNTQDSAKEYSVNLYGKNISGRGGTDYHLFRHEIVNENNEVVQNSPYISLSSSSNIGTITPRARGIAKIRVSHPGADFPIEIIAVVTEKVEFRYIEVEESLIVMSEGDFRYVNVGFVGDAPMDLYENFRFENSDSNVVRLSPSLYSTGITALKGGRSVITVKNKYADFDREILVIVNGKDELIDQEKYITTSQNVITTEVNGEVTLSMTLVGGNSADQNNFIWTVDDGSVIESLAQTGEVRYKNRAAVVTAVEKTEATMLIRALKVGTATITLENPKSSNKAQVTVKVYRAGVLGAVPVVLSGPPIVKTSVGETVDVSLWVTAGQEKYFTGHAWQADSSGVFSVQGNTKMAGVVKGESAGIGTLTVSGSGLKHSFTAIVVVGEGGDLTGVPYIYVNHPFMSVLKGGTASFAVNGYGYGDINIINNSPDRMEVNSYKNNVTVRGIEEGEGEIVIGGEGLNTLKIVVTVEGYALTPEAPYYMRAEQNIYGMVKGRGMEAAVELVGGIVADEKGIKWEIVDPGIADISKNNGRKCIVTGLREGQTVLKASHNKSQNSVEMVVYVALSDAELNSKVIVSVPQQTMLLTLGETRFVSAITNAGPNQSDFRWGSSNAGVAYARVNANKTSAFIEVVSVGSAVITVGYGQGLPTPIFVSVVNPGMSETYVSVPSIVEMYAGQTANIYAAPSQGFNKYDLQWKSQDEKIAKVYGNGDVCTVTALKAGQTLIEVWGAGFAKNVVLRVYANAEEVGTAYIFSSEQSRYVINKGDTVNVSLAFGIRGYPEHDIPNIRWSTDSSAILSIAGNGRSAGVTGMSAGTGTVWARDNYGNSVEIEIAVQETGKIGSYSFAVADADKIKLMLSGTDTFVEVRVFNGLSQINSNGGIGCSSDKPNVAYAQPQDGGIRIYAKAGAEGQAYITLTHDLVDDMRILVCTSLTEGGLSSAYPIMIDKSNYMVEKGSNFNITARTLDDDSAKLRSIEYSLEKNNGTLSIQERSKKELYVSAENVGSEVVLIWYNARVAQRVYVSVMERGYSQNSGYMITENIIGLTFGQVYETRVDCGSKTGIIWQSGDENVVEILREGSNVFDGYYGEGYVRDESRALLRGNGEGRAILTVKQGNVERTILAFVAADEAALASYEAVNIEQRLFRIPKGKEITVNIASWQGKVLGDTEISDYYGYGMPYGGVVQTSKIDNGRLNVKGASEGVAAILVRNNYYRFEAVVYVEVYPVADGSIDSVSKEHYITMEKTLYVLGMEEPGIYMQARVMPDSENFYGDAYWEWYGYDEKIIEVDFLGRGAMVTPIAEGRTAIKVRNKECDNELEIAVIVGERYVVVPGNAPYIYVEKDLYEAVKGGLPIEVPYAIMNAGNPVAANIKHTLAGAANEVSHDAANGVFRVTSAQTGISKLTIKYGALERDVNILVKENLTAGSVYLTTSENFAVVSVGEIRNISVSLMGFDEPKPDNIKWSLKEGSEPNIVQLAGSGLTAQVYGVSEGNVVVQVEHLRKGENAAAYSLAINVRVAKNKEKAVYLTTQRNVIDTHAGAGSDTIYVQKVGGDVLKNKTTWSVDDSSIVSIAGDTASVGGGAVALSGYSARITPRKAGQARITVANEETAYPLHIVVSVRESLDSDIYLSSPNTLVWLEPGDVAQRLSVDLIGGDTQDYNTITWNAYEQIPSDRSLPDGSRVISIAWSNNQCFITALNAGVAHIKVESSKARMGLTITVYVSHYREIGFGVSHKDLVVNEMEPVQLNVPTYEALKDKVRVWAQAPDGKESPVSVYNTHSIALIHGIKPGSAVVYAAVEGKEGVASMTVTVKEKHDPNKNRIIISKSVIAVADTSGPITLNASVVGPDIFDRDLDDVSWELTANYAQGDDIKKERPLLDISPKNVSGYPHKSHGRAAIITPQNIGDAVIRVSHPLVDERDWKDIFVVIEEMGNKFTMDKKEVTVNVSRPAETLSVNIVGGTTKDYESVRWVAIMQQKWDGTLLEVVRIMGSGREVLLFPVNNGETEVCAFYNGEMLSCHVSCVSDYYFDIVNSNEMMYPGEERDIPYEIAPASNSVTWSYTPASELGGAAAAPVVALADIQGSSPGGNGNVTRMLRITALQEGNAVVYGIPRQGIPVAVNITVAYDYELTFNARPNAADPMEHIAAGLNANAPAYSIAQNARLQFDKDHGGIPGRATGDRGDSGYPFSSPGRKSIDYTVFPADTYIVAEGKGGGSLPAGISVEITIPEFRGYDSKRRAVAHGKVTFTADRELTGADAEIKFKLCKPKTGAGDDFVKQTNPSRPTERTLKVPFFFDKVELAPFFVRGEGEYSNIGEGDGFLAAPTSRNRGAQKYWLKDNSAVAGGEMLLKTNNQDYITLGDGEAHYLLFDKYYDNANVNITGLNVDGSGSYIKKVTLLGEGGYEFEAEIVDLPIGGATRKAVKLSGGEDYIEYTRVAFDREMNLVVKSAYPKNLTVEKTSYVPIYEKMYTLNKSKVLPTVRGKWNGFTNPDKNKNGSNNTTYTFYLLKESARGSITNSTYKTIINKIESAGQYITTKAALFDYWDRYEDYLLYIDKNEYARGVINITENGQLNNLISSYCTSVTVKRPLYEYSYDTYNQYESIFANNHEGELWETMWMDERTGKWVGGSFYSYYELNPYLHDTLYGRTYTFYAYEKEKLAELIIYRLNDFNPSLNYNIIYHCPHNYRDIMNDYFHDLYDTWDEDWEETIIYGWIPGDFNSTLIPYMEDYDGENYVYSSYAYKSADIGVDENNLFETGYDVFRNKFYNGQAIGVHFYEKDKPSSIPVSPDDYKTDSGYRRNVRRYGTYSGNGCTWLPDGERSFYIYDFKYKNILEKYTNGGSITSNIGDSAYAMIANSRESFNLSNISASVAQFFSGTQFNRYYSQSGWHKTTNNGGCFNWHDGKGKNANKPNPTGISYPGPKAAQYIEWKDNGSLFIVPYYIFNRFPYRLKNGNGTYVNTLGVNAQDGSNRAVSRPMPSLSRAKFDGRTEDVLLSVEFEKADPNGGKKKDYKRIVIKCVTRPSHMNYLGSDVNDGATSIYVKNSAGAYVKEGTSDTLMELDGNIRDFGLNQESYNNPNLTQFMR